MYRLSVEDKFAAAHQLVSYNGPCENLHGHTWKVKITVEGKSLNDLNMLIDFHDLKIFLKEIHNEFDHKFLNDIVSFSPTSENLAKYIYDKVKNRLPQGIRLVDATVWESETACASYYD